MTSLRVVGYLFLWASFLGGTFLAVQNAEFERAPWRTIAWPWYVGTLVVGSVGVIALRVGQRQEAVRADKLVGDVEKLRRSIASLADKMASLVKQRADLAVDQVHQVIDERLRDDIAEFVDARESLIHTYSMQHYADLMTDFAIAERYVNRAWSASADGYIDEVWSCLELAHKKFTAVAKRLFALDKIQASRSDI